MSDNLLFCFQELLVIWYVAYWEKLNVYKDIGKGGDKFLRFLPMTYSRINTF